MYIIIGNYGNNSVALMQWVIEQPWLGDHAVQFLTVETGWAAEKWSDRITQGEAYARSYGITPVRLSSTVDFANLVTQRNSIPVPKYRWCATLLKGVIINDYLNEIDIEGKACILLAKRRVAARLYQNLPEFINSSPYYDERKIWYPMYQYGDQAWRALIERTPLPFLEHRSLECDPCIHGVTQLDERNVAKTAALEKKIGKPFFTPEAYGGAEGIEEVVEWLSKDASRLKLSEEVFANGCSSPWACGD